MPEAVVYKRPGDDLTGTPTAPVTGKRMVNISGDLQADGTLSIAPAAAAGLALGVAAHDGAIGAKVPIIAGTGTIVPVIAEGAIAAGAEVEVGAAAGVRTKAAGVAVGRVITSAADGGDARVRLY